MAKHTGEFARRQVERQRRQARMSPAAEGAAAVRADDELRERARVEIQTVSTDVLLLMARSSSETRRILHNELGSRGVGPDGSWITHRDAETFWATAYFTGGGQLVSVPEDDG